MVLRPPQGRAKQESRQAGLLPGDEQNHDVAVVLVSLGLGQQRLRADLEGSDLFRCRDSKGLSGGGQLQPMKATGPFLLLPHLLQG